MKKQTKLYQKWWFWVCIVLIVCVISSIIIITILINKKTVQTISNTIKNTSNIYAVAIQIQNIYNDATLYGSAGKKTLILELKNFDSTKNATEYRNIITTIKNHLDNELSNYKELVIIQYSDNDKEQKHMLITTTYSLPDFMEKENKAFISFESYTDLYNTYTDLYNTYDKAMDSYTDLYMSIGR